MTKLPIAIAQSERYGACHLCFADSADSVCVVATKYAVKIKDVAEQIRETLVTVEPLIRQRTARTQWKRERMRQLIGEFT